jgi:DNA-binding NarL/FixJ family response regulator
VSVNPRVLVVDDDPLVLQTTAQYLTAKGFDVAVAADAVSAEACVREHLPDVVVADLIMPHTDGFAMMERIKRIAPDVEFLVISGYGRKEDAIKSLRMGSVDFFDKPAPLSELADACRRAYAKKLSRQSGSTDGGRGIIRELLRASTDDRERLLETVNFRLQKIVYPEIDQMAARYDDEDTRAGLLFIKELLEGIFAPSNPLSSHYGKLSPLEIKICNFLIQGKTSQEVANALNRSLDTIYDHQKRIRNRLGLTNSRESLATFLRGVKGSH